ncbi:MAG: hypothetical protein IH988_06545 [Planctomycetes bacterium]|nr:hypothetical protein [Planctomycetota bacterium]
MSTLFARRLGSLITGSLAVLLPATAATAQIPCGYEVTAVIQGPWCGEIFGYPPTRGRAVTEDGAVVGYYTSCDIGPGEAFYWSESTGFVTLDRPAGYTSATARDIDGQTGWIIGALSTPGTDGPFAALWPAWSAEPIDLGTLPGGDYSQAFAVSAGRVVGKWGNQITGDPAIQAFLWQDNQMIDLGPDLGTPSGWAWDVNQAGQVCGWMGTATSLDARAFIWDAGQVTELPAIPGGFTSEGLAISADGGTVVGVGRLIDKQTGDVIVHPFLWKDGKMIDLGVLPGHVLCGAFDIREGKIIGGCWFPLPESAFIYQDGIVTDLNDFIPADAGVELLGASAINTQGHITGRGHNGAGDLVAYLLTPINPPVGDLDGDCAVGIFDLLILLRSWGPCAGCPADLDDDGTVGIFDLLTLLSNWE